MKQRLTDDELLDFVAIAKKEGIENKAQFLIWIRKKYSALDTRVYNAWNKKN